MRRYDELRQSVATVPDGSSLTPTRAGPALHPEEVNANFVEAVCAKASSGVTARDCEKLRADSHRVARGALKLNA